MGGERGITGKEGKGEATEHSGTNRGLMGMDNAAGGELTVGVGGVGVGESNGEKGRITVAEQQ